MSNFAIVLLAVSVLLTGCDSNKNVTTNPLEVVSKTNQETISHAAALETNPFFQDYGTPFGIPPFDKITSAHYAPAFDKAIAEAQREILVLANNPEESRPPNNVKSILNLYFVFLRLTIGYMELFKDSTQIDRPIHYTEIIIIFCSWFRFYENLNKLQ